MLNIKFISFVSFVYLGLVKFNENSSLILPSNENKLYLIISSQILSVS